MQNEPSYRVHQHVVQHHIHTNDVHLDPDISIEFYVRLNPKHPILAFQFLQYIYFFGLAALFGIQKVMTSIGKAREELKLWTEESLLNAPKLRPNCVAKIKIICFTWKFPLETLVLLIVQRSSLVKKSLYVSPNPGGLHLSSSFAVTKQWLIITNSNWAFWMDNGSNSNSILGIFGR